MSKHTPGPWEHVPGEGIVSRAAWIVPPSADQAGIPVVIVATLGAMGGEDSAADARLLAAAPELLAALRRSLNWLSAYPGGLSLDCYDQARAAIAKATGEQ